MMRLIDRLACRAASGFVGRDVELALIGQSLGPQPPQVPVFLIHGPGGVGKTALLERLRSVAVERGFQPLRLDARDVEPSPEGLLRALGAALGIAAEDACLAYVLERWSETPRRLWLLDSFEHLSHLQGWLRQVLLPELPDPSVVLIAGRALPDADWQIDPLWREGARVVALTNLAAHEAAHLLARRGVPAQHRPALVALSYGHPLALSLLADLGAGGGDMPAALSTDVVRQLCDRFVAQVPSDLHRRALELCAKTRFTTEGLLADVLDAVRAHELFEWLASLSFMQAAPGGLFPHDLVRDAIDDELHWRHPERHRDVHTALRTHFRAQSMRSGAGAGPHAQFDLMYLYRRSPVLARYIDFRALGSVWFEPYAHRDRAGVLAVAERELSMQECRQIEGWLDHPAAHVQVLRPAPGAVSGAMLSIDVAALTAAERARDPAIDAIWRTLQSGGQPLAPGQRCLVARHHIAAGGVPQASATMNALQLSQGFQWATLPRLAQYVNCLPEPDYWTAIMEFFGFARMPDCDFVATGVPHGCWMHDWRVQPLGQWQEMIAARQLGLPEPGLRSGPTAGETMGRFDLRYAVRDALRLYTDADALQASPLLGCAFVRRSCRPGEDPAQALRRLLLETAQALREKRRDEKFWRALESTFFRPAGSQELAAERLGLPFGTYRYQLATGIDRMADTLWRRELAARGI